MLDSHNYIDFNTNLKALHICQKDRFVGAFKEFEIYRAFKYKNSNNCGNILNDQLNF